MAWGWWQGGGTGRAVGWMWRGTVGRMFSKPGIPPWRAGRPSGESEFEHMERVDHPSAPGMHQETLPGEPPPREQQGREQSDPDERA